MTIKTPSLGMLGRPVGGRLDPEADSASPTSVASTTDQHRRSIISIASSLRPAKGKLHKLWPATKGPVVDSEFKDWTKSDLSTVIRLAGFQMGALGNPANPMSPDLSTSMQSDLAEPDSPNDDVSRPMTVPAPSRAPPPPPRAPRPPWVPPSLPSVLRRKPCPPVPLPVPERAPPPPPPAIEPSLLNHIREGDDLATFRPPTPPTRPVPTFRRRAKTPVRQIGQLERASRLRKQVDGVQRTSSVCTIARQYRELVEYPDVLAVDSGHDQPETAGFNHQGQEESQGSVLLELAQDRRRSLLAPSPVSDDGTLVAFDEEATQCKPLSVSPPATPVTREPELEADEDAVPAPATLRFQIGLELLTRELSSALGHRAAGDGNDASGLQIWVMIEAYERLRDQIAGTGPGNEEAREAIDSWLEALHAIHRTMAGEAAMSDSEYED